MCKQTIVVYQNADEYFEIECFNIIKTFCENAITRSNRKLLLLFS